MSSVANLGGFFKQRYGDFINPLPSDNTIADFGKFVQQDRRPGDKYNFPIQVGLEHGQTANTDGSAFPLNSAIDSQTKNALLEGATIALIGNVPYDVLFKASNGAGNGSQGGSFMTAMDYKVKALMQSGELYRELSLLYGPGSGAVNNGGNIGVVSASKSGANLGANQFIIITRATWIPGMWNQMINALVDIYQSDGTTIRDTGVTVVSVPVTVAGSVGCEVKLFKSASSATVATGDIIVPTGWRAKTCFGLQPILENATTLFGIDASIYPMWNSVKYVTSGTLGRAKILNMAAQLFPNGPRNGGKLFVSGPTFADLAEEADALQRYTENTDAIKRQGAENLLYKSPIGNIEVAVHTYMKQDFAFFLATDQLKRVGASDLTFRGDGMDDWFLLQLPSNAGFQMRIYSNQAPVLEIPYWCAEISGFTNSGDIVPA